MANFCPKCGKPVDPNVAFCSNCGANIESPEVGNNTESNNAQQKQPKKFGFGCFKVGCGLFLCFFVLSCLANMGKERQNQPNNTPSQVSQKMPNNSNSSTQKSQQNVSNNSNTSSVAKNNYEDIKLDDLLLDIDSMSEGKKISTSGYATKGMGEDDCIDLYVTNDSIGKSLYVDIKKCSRDIRKKFLKEEVLDDRIFLKVKGQIKNGTFVGNYLEADEANSY